MVWRQTRIFVFFIFYISPLCKWQCEIFEDGQKNQEQLFTFSSRSSALCLHGFKLEMYWTTYITYSHEFTRQPQWSKTEHKPHVHRCSNKLDMFPRKILQRKLHVWLGSGKVSHSGALWPQNHYRRKGAWVFQKQILPTFRDTHAFPGCCQDISALLLKVKAECSDLG